MIAYLRGRLTRKQPPGLTVEVSGVGYDVEAPMSTFYVLPEIGTDLTLLTHLVVREDAHILYGFATERERQLFRSLLKVSGVGARMALAILSGIDSEAFVQYVRAGDATSLVSIPGVGKKTAERLVVELRDRIDQGVVPAGASSTGGPASTTESDAFSALVALGYKSSEVARMLRAVDTNGQSTEEIIRQALQAIAETT